MHNDLAIELSQVSFGYESVPVLQRVDLRIHRNEFIGIMGPNGGGKTSFLKLLMGFLSPSKGKIAVFGKKPSQARTRIGYVPQVFRTDRDFPITLLDLVLLGALSRSSFFGIYPTAVKKKALYLIDLLGLAPHKHKMFGSLSGGLAQRALLARALLSDPDLLLLDEPTANIDPSSSAILFDLLQELKGRKTILIVTHDLRTTIERFDRVLCVQGHINSYLPKEVCEHFAMGLYHTPLLHSQKGSDVIQLVH